MTESDIRDEIVRLLGQKYSMPHDLSNVLPKDFDFVRCSNRKVRCIDGDVPFDANGINQVYKNGSVYVCCNIPFATNFGLVSLIPIKCMIGTFVFHLFI